MTNKSKMKLKKFNFLSQHRTTPITKIAPITENNKYRIKRKDKKDENIFGFTRRSLRPQYI